MEGPPPQKNIDAELAEMFAADQQDRRERLYEKDRDLFRTRDQERMARARKILEEHATNEISPEGLYNLAIFFQHGEGPEDYLKAEELARESEARGHEYASWLVAAAEDRRLLSLGQKQKRGTQMHVKDGRVELMDMLSDEESGITDEMRAAKLVATRAEMQEQIEEANREMQKEQTDDKE